MKKFFLSFIALTGLLFMCTPGAKAIGWPANYEGVMLQGFYWDSFADTKWTNLESQADELAENFTLIWVPNSGRCSNATSMGYDPVYWFSNHNTKFGTEAEVRSMIKTLKSKGVGVIADVVINHRNGKSNWTDFPAETWNGQTWKIGTDGICCTDEVKDAAGQAKPTGAPDTGEDFNGARDLDHTNANVQNNCKNYCKFLLEDMGYSGFRLDMTKGYGGQYTKIYNQYSKPEFCVGEYFDANYDLVAGWIEATGRTSAAFDFAFKYQCNKAFTSGNYTELVWKANGTTDQPAGMIHFGYPQYAVTFIDNHDTYRDGSKFTGNVLAANAFMLSCPGTPCVFLPHWKQHKAEIKAMIAARKAAGIHNMSPVRVIRSSGDCYLAEVTGTKGKLAVKIGPAMVSPDGYTNADIKATGNDYCIWVKTNGGGGGGNTGSAFTVYFDNSKTGWTTPYIHYWGSTESTWPGVAMTKAEGNIWKYTVPAGTTGILFNAGDGDATKTSDFTAAENHLYNQSGDQGVYNGGGGGGNDNPGNPFNVYFDNSVAKWTTPHIHHWGSTESTWPGVAMTKAEGNIWKYTVPAGTTGILFNAGDGDATKTSDFTAVENHLYNQSGDQGVYNGGGDDPTPIPAGGLYIIGEPAGGWSANVGKALEGTDGVYSYTATFTADWTYFGFATKLGSTATDWEILNANRYGSLLNDELPEPDENGNTIADYYTLSAGRTFQMDYPNATSFRLAPGTYILTIDTKALSLKVQTTSAAIDNIEIEDVPAVYFNLQGMPVENPSNGIFIRVQGRNASKVYIR